MRLRYLFPLFLMILLLSACGTQPYLKQDSAFILLKTPTMRYADQGFVYANADEVKVEIYSSGKALFSLRVTPSSVCTGTLQCMSKKRFNEKVLSSYYPEDTMEKIFRAKPIFNGTGVIKKRNGFTQKIINGDKYYIEYEVLNNQTIFRYTINHILIKIKRL